MPLPTPMTLPDTPRPRRLAGSRATALATSFTLALLLASAGAQAQPSPAPAPARPQAAAQGLAEPALRLLRPYQVWRNELPDRLDPAEVEVVVLSPDTLCKPPPLKGLFGMSVSALPPVTGALCRRIDSFAKAPPVPLPMPVRVHAQPLTARHPAAVLASIEPAPTRRYVALVYWAWSQPKRDIHWFFEVAVVDRDSGRWVWHGARGNEVSYLPDWQARTEIQALQALLVHELPRDLLHAAWWRDDLPVPGSRWVPLDELPAYRPAADRAGLAVVNSYYSDYRMQDLAALKLWPAAGTEINDDAQLRQGEPSGASTVRRAQSTPILAVDTHVLLDLPAGDYQMRVYTSTEPVTLAPGRVTVLNVKRTLGNGKSLNPETEAWWRDKVLGERGRHAFLAEPSSRGQPAVVPYFQDTQP